VAKIVISDYSSFPGPASTLRIRVLGQDEQTNAAIIDAGLTAAGLLATVLLITAPGF
jgi:hypothetical protein